MRGTIRWRAVWLGVFCGLLICAATPYNNAYLGATLLAGGHFPLAPFFILIWLTLFAALYVKIFRRSSFLNGMELITVWILSVVVSGVAYTGLARTFFVNITAPIHFATVGNRWSEVLHPLMSSKLHPTDASAVRALYNGLAGGANMSFSQVMAAIPWSAWAAPLIAWSVLILLSYMVMLCLVNLFSTQWIINERVNFPLLQAPRVMAGAFEEGRIWDFFTNRYLLMGVILSCFLHTVNGLHFYIPSVPEIPTLFLAGGYFPKVGLFSGFQKLKIYIYPAFIGFAFLTSRQISFSFWVFFMGGCIFYGVLSMLGMTIPSSALGVTFGPTLAQPEETQMVGAYGVFFLFIVWLARRHLVQTFGQAFSTKPQETTPSEWISARASLWGVIIGFILLLGWCVYFGMGVFPAILVLGAFFMVMLVATKTITQGGIPYFTLTAAPTDGLLGLFGSGFLSQIGLMLTVAMQKVLFVDLRESLMPSLVHAAKVTEAIRNKRRIVVGLSVVIVLSVAVSFAAMLFVCYKYGVRELHLDWTSTTSVGVYENVQRLIEAPAGPREWVVTYSIAGAVVMALLVLCYQRFPWWPLHPIGYLVTYSSAMRILWFSFFLGWLCNSLALRYGGVLLFKRLRFLFIGFIVGDFLMGGFWAIIGLWLGQSYQVLPS
ncbi:MAG: hypothetical protein PWQ57_722 [Desulfovibrionales bacterium]|nr:hypothetical protein [Desulfovibrionales bacterium]